MNCTTEHKLYSVHENPTHTPMCTHRRLARGFSQSGGYRAAWIEPGDLQLLVEAMFNRLIFLSPHYQLTKPENRLSSKPPLVAATCRVSPLRVRTPTAKRCALATRPASGWLGFPRWPDVATAPLALGATLRQETPCGRLLPRYRSWQSASSTPTRAADGFSWTSPSALDVVAPTAQDWYSRPSSILS